MAGAANERAVRTLENAVEFATAVCEGRTVHVTDLPTEIGAHPPSGEDTGEPLPIRGLHRPSPAQPTLRTHAVSGPESDRRSHGPPEPTPWTPAAARLGMRRTTLWRKMKQYGL
jgi:transcriptional regulator of acetoin/glycerol metabolism